MNPWDEVRARANLDESKVAAAAVAIRKRQIRELESELRNARSLLAAVVCQYGESLGNDRYRLAVTSRNVDAVDGMEVRVILEPNSGAVLLRLGPPLSP